MKFARLMKAVPLIGSTKPIAVELATWRCDGMTFELGGHGRYPL